MIWLVRLYPKVWRQRYGEEFQAILASKPMSPGLVMDVMAGALDARIHPQPHIQSSESTKGDTMTAEMMKRCAFGGPWPSKQERKSATVGMLVASLVVAILYMALTKIYRSAPAVQAFGAAGFPAVALFYQQMAYLRRRPVATRVLLVGGMIALLYLFLWGVCLLATRI